MVHGEVELLEDRRALELVGGHFIVACLHRDPELQGLRLELAHEGLGTLGNATEVVIFQLLSFRRTMAEEGPARHHDIRTGVEQCLVDEEIFLLPA